MTRNLFGDFLLRRLLTDFRGCDLFGRCRYPLRVEKVPQISQINTDFFLRFFVTQISQMTQIFLRGNLWGKKLQDDFRYFTFPEIYHGVEEAYLLSPFEVFEREVCLTDDACL